MVAADMDTNTNSVQPQKGTYIPSKPSDLRSPCPMINCLANHGYLPRDGRNVHHDDFSSAIKYAGLSISLAAAFSNPIMIEHQDPKSKEATTSTATAPQPSIFSKLVTFASNPWSVLSKFALRPVGQVDGNGLPYLNLDQLALHGAVEHDISLTRGDLAQGDNVTLRKDLIENILAASSDGGLTVTMKDFAAVRRSRIETQRQENQQLMYGRLENELGAGEISLMLTILGDGKKVDCAYLRAFLLEERLPLEEGWTPRRWWTLGLVELKLTVNKVKALVGIKL